MDIQLCSKQECENNIWNKTRSLCYKHNRRFLKHGDADFVYNQKGLAHYNKTTYSSYKSMKRRCYDTNSVGYKYWGGKGIAVCDRWVNSFNNFIEDMGVRPEHTTLDRIDNSKNYSPENCRWADSKTQSVNRSNVTMVIVDGIADTLRGHAISRGLKYKTVWQRINAYNKTIEEALS